MESWKHRESTYKAIDEKADSIIKYLGGGTGSVVPTNAHSLANQNESV